ncbi:LysM peptidoglycan-binding domain-containing protein [bacterium]|nr:LysM peptidoglycan-binding domain-containing protein [bacterium]
MLENLLSGVQANTTSHVFRPAVMQPAVVPPASLPSAPVGLGQDVYIGGTPPALPSAPLSKQQYEQLVDNMQDLLGRLRAFRPSAPQQPAAPAKPPEAAKPNPAPAKPQEPPKAESPKKPAAPAPAKPPAPAPSAGPTFTVGDGDTMWGIAQKHLGDGARWPELYALNKDVIGPNPNVIHAGQVLKLPGGAAKPAEPTPAPKPAAPPAPKPATGGTHTVSGSDSLWSIAQRYLGDGNRWGEIYQLNKDVIGPNPNVIQGGMTLKLPSGAAAKPAPAAVAPSSGRNTNRGAIYIQQPNGWSCAPTSLTMAMAAFGVRPANQNTVQEAIRLTGANANVGLPGNASLVASAARKVGLQAQFVGDSSAGSVRAALNRGHGVVLNGSISGQGGHFVYIAGIQNDGRFIVCDPWRPNITSWSDAELNHFATGYSVNPRGFAEIWK